MIGRSIYSAMSGGLWLPLSSWLLFRLCTVAQIHVNQALIRHLVLLRELLEVDEAALLDADGDRVFDFAVVRVADPLHL